MYLHHNPVSNQVDPEVQVVQVYHLTQAVHLYQVPPCLLEHLLFQLDQFHL